MDATAFEDLVEALDAERHKMVGRVEELRAALGDAELRLRDLDGVIGGLQRLDLVQAQEAVVEATDAEDLERSDRAELAAVPTSPDGDEQSGKQRIRSTEMVADLVNRSGTPLSRDEVIERFRVDFGFPASWTNPRNAIGNALGRASNRGWISQLDGDRFAPQNWRGLEPTFERGALTTG